MPPRIVCEWALGLLQGGRVSETGTPDIVLQSSSSSEFHTANEDTLRGEGTNSRLGRAGATPNHSVSTSGPTPSEYEPPGSTPLASLSGQGSGTNTLVHSEDEEELSALEMHADVDHASSEQFSRAVICEAK